MLWPWITMRSVFQSHGSLERTRRSPGRRRDTTKLNYERGFRRHLEVDRLEDRTLLANWTAIGPAPQHDPLGVSLTPNQDVTGRVSALAFATIGGNTVQF